MRWLIPTLAAAATVIALPATAQTYGYGYGYGQSGYGYGQSDYGYDFDYRRCYSNESRSACRDRLQRQSGQRDDGWGYPRYNRNYGDAGRYGDYGRYQDYGRYGDYNRYGGSYDQRGGYYDQRGGYDQGYYGNNGYYGGGYYDQRGDYGGYDGASVALTILGIALGSQILGSLDDRDYWDRNRHDDGYNDWCRRQYSSYDWNSGTYRHQDGSRRYCRRW